MLAVVSVSPTGTVNEVVDQVDVTFNKVMNTSTLNGSNITLTGPGGAVAVGQGYLVSGDTYAIPIAPQRANGSYQLTIGTGVQAQEGTPLGSAFQASFTVSLPDLVVSSVQPSVGSTTFGATINIGWTVTNNGTAGATGPWTDNVYLSATPALGAGAIYLGSFTAESSGSLAPSGTYNGQATVSLPIDSSLTAGSYYLVVVADAGGVVNESDLTTQQNSAPITLSRPAAAGPGCVGGDVVADRGAAGPVGNGDLDKSRTWAARRRPARGSTTSISRRTASSDDATLLGSVTETGGLAAAALVSQARSRPRFRAALPTAVTR